MTGRHRCIVCATRHLPIDDQVERARWRVGMVPPALRRAVVPSYLWPPGQRWCGSCQSFVDLADVQGSRCRACASSAAHSKRIEKTYGLDREAYDALLKLQGGRCAICRARPKSKRLAVDHDHKTGVVRGLLCSRCNHDLMGAAWDSQAMALALLGYISAPPAAGHWTAPEDSGRPAAVAGPGALSGPGGTTARPNLPVAPESLTAPHGLTASELYSKIGAMGVPGGGRILVFVKAGEPAPF